jgi:LPXTG-motif cell wall-anchored protein
VKQLFGPLIALCLLIASPEGMAQTSTAYDSASCRATFIRSCDGETSAAPAPIVGAGMIEGGALLVGGLYWWARRRKKRRAEVVEVEKWGS